MYTILFIPYKTQANLGFLFFFIVGVVWFFTVLLISFFSFFLLLSAITVGSRFVDRSVDTFQSCDFPVLKALPFYFFPFCPNIGKSVVLFFFLKLYYYYHLFVCLVLKAKGGPSLLLHLI